MPVAARVCYSRLGTCARPLLACAEWLCGAGGGSVCGLWSHRDHFSLRIAGFVFSRREASELQRSVVV